MEYSTATHTRKLEDRIIEQLSMGNATRSQLCDTLDVSRTVLGRALVILQEDGAVVTIPSTPTQRRSGRPVGLLKLADNVAHSIGINISRHAAAGVVLDRGGRTLANIVLPNTAHWFTSFSALCDALEVRMREENIDMAYVSRVGVGIPMPVSNHTSAIVSNTDTVVVIDEVKHHWDVPVIVDNCVRMAALGEASWGVGSGLSSHLYVRLSGGVGGCVITSDEVTGGSSGFAGELGHIRVPGNTRPCACGKTGCVETLASIPALCDIASVPDLRGLREAVDQGEAAACRALDEAVNAVGAACAAIVLMMNPQAVIIDGELVEVFPHLVDRLHDVIAAEAIPSIVGECPVIRASMDEDVATRGAALAAEMTMAARQRQRMREPARFRAGREAVERQVRA